MASNCQVPTPPQYVIELLDSIGYTQDLYDKSVLENSCGEGNILVEVVKRYIISSIEEGYSKKDIVLGLEKNIIGYDVDSTCVKKCIDNLDNIAREYRLGTIHWNIFEKDYLKCEASSYDFIIGNPPYITYHDLTEEQRKFIREHYSTCKKGRFDYCYAFIEAGLRDLSANGKLAYLIPYSVIRNKYADKVRVLMKEYLKNIIDYKGIQIFPNTVTSSIAILCDKEKKDSINYYNKIEKKQRVMSKDSFGGKWIFEEETKGSRRFGDFFKVSNSIATLCNEVFIFEVTDEDDTFLYFKNEKVEKKIAFDAVSTKSEKKYQKNKRRDKIIFPYKKIDGNILSYDEEEFRKLFPECYSYLTRHKDRLMERKSSKGVQWFEYGRVQAINSIFTNKLIMPVVITNNVYVYEVGTESVPYAGVYIRTREKSRMGLDEAKKILLSNPFYKYIKKCGTPTTSSSYRISVKDIEDYHF